MTLPDDYTGIGALAWELYSGGEPGPDVPFFQAIVTQHGGPILDVGCGTGRLLIPYLEAGLDVEGVDPTADMLAICREKLEARGLKTALYPQAMQSLELPRRYRTMIVPCGTIQLVVNRDEAQEALRRLYMHLEPGGLLALTLYNHWSGREDARPGEWKFRARRALPDGTEVDKFGMVIGSSHIEQTIEQQVRYRRFRGEEILEERICAAPERFFFLHELTLMLEKAEFRVSKVTGNYTDEPACDAHYVFTLFAVK